MVTTITAASPDCLSKRIIQIKVNGVSVDGLLGTGNSSNYINFNILKSNQWKFFPCSTQVSIANVSLSSQVIRYCLLSLHLKIIRIETSNSR